MTSTRESYAGTEDGHLAWGDVVDERYEIHRPLGHGGMGSVYLARDREFDRLVALKVLTPKYVGRPEREKRFDHEARYGGRIPHHTNIAMTIDAGRMANGRPYIVMEYVEGPAINVLAIFEGRKLELPRLLELMVGVAEALCAMHRVGVVHRDLTPTNILVTQVEGRSVAKVIDFSHAAADVPRLRVGDPRRLTGAHEIPGTPGYMPPEQVRSDPAEPRMDVFSFGIVLWELLSGKHAFRHLEREEYFELQASTPTAPEPLSKLRPDLPAALCRLVEDCTHIHIAARPSASSVVLRLKEIIEGVHVRGPRLAAVRAAHGARTMEPEVVRVAPSIAPSVGTARRAESSSAPDVCVRASFEAVPPVRRRWGLLAVFAVVVLLLGVAIVVVNRLRSSVPESDPHATVLPSVRDAESGDEARGASGSTTAEPELLPEISPAPSPPDTDPDPSSVSGSDDGAGGEPAPEPAADATPSRSRRGKSRRPNRSAPRRPAVVDTGECEQVRAAALDAKRGYDWKGVLTSTERSSCWSGPQRKRLRVQAFLELGRYEACVHEGSGASDPKVVKLVETCEGAVR